MSRNSNYKQKKTIKNSVYNPTQSSACHGVAFGRRRVLSLQSPSFPTQSSFPDPHSFNEICTDLLYRGHRVRFAAPGNSMHPAIRNNDTIVIEPIDPSAVHIGDIILYRSDTGLIAHRVVDKKENERLKEASFRLKANKPVLPAQNSGIFDKCSAPQISLKAGCSSPHKTAGSSTSAALIFILRGDSAATCDQPVKPDQILGKVIALERNGRSINPYSLSHKLFCLAYKSGSRVKSFFV